MPKYMTLFSLTSDSIARFLQNPEDRRDPVSQLAQAAGGSLEAYYWMFGAHDGFVIFQMPDSEAMAAAVLAITSSGALHHVETHELIEAQDLVKIAQRAQQARSSYRPPGGGTG